MLHLIYILFTTVCLYSSAHQHIRNTDKNQHGKSVRSPQLEKREKINTQTGCKTDGRTTRQHAGTARAAPPDAATARAYITAGRGPRGTRPR